MQHTYVYDLAPKLKTISHLQCEHFKNQSWLQLVFLNVFFSLCLSSFILLAFWTGAGTPKAFNSNPPLQGSLIYLMSSPRDLKQNFRRQSHSSQSFFTIDLQRSLNDNNLSLCVIIYQYPIIYIVTLIMWYSSEFICVSPRHVSTPALSPGAVSLHLRHRLWHRHNPGYLESCIPLHTMRSTIFIDIRYPMHIPWTCRKLNLDHLESLKHLEWDLDEKPRNRLTTPAVTWLWTLRTLTYLELSWHPPTLSSTDIWHHLRIPCRGWQQETCSKIPCTSCNWKRVGLTFRWFVVLTCCWELTGFGWFGLERCLTLSNLSSIAIFLLPHSELPPSANQ